MIYLKILKNAFVFFFFFFFNDKSIFIYKQVGGEELYLLHKSLKTLGQETRNFEVDLNEALNQAATCKQTLKHLEPDVQAIQGRKDLEAKIAEYTQCKYFRVEFSSILIYKI